MWSAPCSNSSAHVRIGHWVLHDMMIIFSAHLILHLILNDLHILLLLLASPCGRVLLRAIRVLLGLHRGPCLHLCLLFGLPRLRGLQREEAEM